MGIRDCPAAVSGNDRRHKHWRRVRAWEATASRDPSGRDRAGSAHESEDLPAHRARRVRWSEAAWDGRRQSDGATSAACDVAPPRPRTDPGPIRTSERARSMTVTDQQAPPDPRPHARCRCASATATRARRRQQDRPRRRRVCDDLAEVDPMRVATRTISGLYDGATTRRARPAVDPDRGRDDRRGAAVLPARRTAAGQLHRQGGPRPGHRVVQPGDRARPRRGAHRRRDGRVRRGQRPQARRRDRR